MSVFGSKTSRGKTGGTFAATPADNPLDGVEYGDEPDVEADSKAEASALLKSFKRRRKTEDKRFRDATDSEFWFAVCFRTRDEKNAFLDALGARRQCGDKYLDGHKLAQIMGIEMP